MTEISSKSPDRYGYDFIPAEYLPPGEDEYWQRNGQTKKNRRNWRKLQSQEIEILIKNENYCANWDNFLVTDPFEPALVRNSCFYGLIRLGVLREVLLQHHDFRIPAGIRNSTIISCDIGDDTAIQNCSYISHYIIGSTVILSRIDEMQTTNHAKFGNGVTKDGEDEDVRIWIDVMNEAGGRSILPFTDMIPADAYLWAAYRDDTELTSRLKTITQKSCSDKRGLYGTVGSGSVIKSCSVIKDTAVGEAAYIKGANKLKNITILSSQEEPTQVGEGVELVNGIVGYGSHIFYGSKAVRFVIGRNCNLKYGARLIHSVLGDNSTVSCCEILNNLIFPVHEQHHNNSFLIASLIQGLSNLAAGATIGSNHNSRANDGEIRAGRGFWPGLSVTLKHSSCFAAFVLIAKGNYPYELNITLPFSLVNNNTKKDRLEVMPAYFWMYNLYALERNSWKAANRDKRAVKVQHIEMDYLAPDTAGEIIAALARMEAWMSAAGIDPASLKTLPAAAKLPDPASAGEEEDPEYAYIPETDEEIPAPGLERHKRGTVLLKPRKAWDAYREMLHTYAMKNLIACLQTHPQWSFTEFAAAMEEGAPYGQKTEWVNLGGQIMSGRDADLLRQQIREGKISTWEAIHAEYDRLWENYPLDKARHAWSVLNYLGTGRFHGTYKKTAESFREELDRTLEIRRWMAEQVYLSRAKDFHDPFRTITYRNKAEMEQVAGRAEDNFFVKLVREDLECFEKTIGDLKKRLSEYQ